MTLKVPTALDSLGKVSVPQAGDVLKIPPVALIQVGTPTAPPAGTDLLYSKSDDGIYTQNPLGQESQIATFAIAAALAIALG
jgi:hypothetical protein